ncbi:LytTR family transcriptional regulator [Mesorhizobium sp. AR07]|uniref:LytTR family DNA-binding domain-containing protein n=1 Tax=Mesorhizobium sp. AR07 TaxID=2865838 RepID=UPI00215E9E79|nr:LytTR family DNA-binding domain-containing protein [Mesorhizobium sp. AR07]UVK41875.1 LytTR family transcriptional regulator [Mesorhizobium sp. AR07]
MADMPRADKGQDLERRVLRRIFWPASVSLAGVAMINVMTLLTEAQRAGTPLDAGIPLVLEFSSVSVLLVLIPLMSVFMRMVPLQPSRWLVALPLYLGMSIAFSALHVLGMVTLRKALFWVFWGRSYIFFRAPLTDFLYEYRKDLLSFSVIVVICHLVRRLEEKRREPTAAGVQSHPAGRLALRSGSRTVWVDAATFEWASAAGNYVEFHGGGSHLLRMTLLGLEDLLTRSGVDVVRVHRSRIVNRAKVREVLPTRDGDFVVRLLSGAEVRGSRRYREILAVDASGDSCP